MSSTNKTPNYDLSQYVGTDKPTYLGDYNGDMLKIDTQMKANNNAATNAQASAGEATTKVSKLENTVESIDTRVNSVELTQTSQGQLISQMSSNVTSLSSDNTTNKNNISSLQTELSKNTWEEVKITGTYASPMKAFRNKFSNLLNIFGTFSISGGTSSRTVLFNLNNVFPSSDREIISGIGIVTSSDGLNEITGNFTIKQNGDVVFNDEGTAKPYAMYTGKMNLMLNTGNWGLAQ